MNSAHSDAPIAEPSRRHDRLDTPAIRDPPVRYTLTRWPSRMVMVGRRLRNRFIVWAVAWLVASPTPPAMTIVRSPSPAKPALPEELAQPGDQTHRGGRAERGQVVLIHLIAESGVADLVEADELIRGRYVRPSGSSEPMERDGEPRLAERLHGLRFAEHAGAGRNQDVLSAVRVHRVRDETVHRRGAASVETVGEDRVDERALEQPMQRARCG